MSPIPQNANSFEISAPTGGWNTRDDRQQMDPKYALDMENWFPEEQDVVLRGGCEEFVSGLGGPVETLYEHVAVDGTRTFLAGAAGSLYSIGGGSASSIGSGFTNDRWQIIAQMDAGAGVSLLLNGEDTPRIWNGSSISSASITGISDPKTLIQGTNFRGRIFAVAVDDPNVYYLPFGAVSGAAAAFPVGSIFQRGGYPLFVTTWTRNAGETSSEQLVIVSSEGELLLYAGTSPDSEGFTLIGRRFLAQPFGRRSFCKRGLDVEIATLEGAPSLAAVVVDPRASEPDTNPTRNISAAWIDAARDFYALHGWEAVAFRLGKKVVYNVPISATSSVQFVRNTITGAWCKFTGWPARTFAVFSNKLYFGAPDGKVYRADSGTSDASASIDTNLRWAYNYLGDRSNQKQLGLARPILSASNDVSFGLGADVDFEDGPNPGTVTTEASAGSSWNQASWNQAKWKRAEVSSKNWYAIEGLGRAIALKMTGQFKNTAMRLSAIHVTYTRGGVL